MEEKENEMGLETESVQRVYRECTERRRVRKEEKKKVCERRDQSV